MRALIKKNARRGKTVVILISVLGCCFLCSSGLFVGIRLFFCSVSLMAQLVSSMFSHPCKVFRLEKEIRENIFFFDSGVRQAVIITPSINACSHRVLAVERAL